MVAKAKGSDMGSRQLEVPGFDGWLEHPYAREMVTGVLSY